MGALRKAFPEAETSDTKEPVSIINIKSMIPTFSTREEKPDRKLPLTQFQSNLDDALTSLAKGKRKGRSNKHLPKGVLLKPPKFPSLYLLSSEKTMTEPQKVPVDWFTLTGHLETSVKGNFSIPTKDFDDLEIQNRRALAVLSHLEWFSAYLDYILRQDELDIQMARKVVSSIGLSITQAVRDLSYATANFTLLRRDAALTKLPANVLEEHRRELRTGSFRGPDLFQKEDILIAHKALQDYTSNQASLQLLSLKPHSAYTVSQAPKPRYDRDRKTQQTVKKFVPQHKTKSKFSGKSSSKPSFQKQSFEQKKDAPYHKSTFKKGGRGGRRK